MYLLIAVCNVHSASYYYRAGREVVVPVAEELIVAEEARKEDPLIALETLEVVPAELVDPAQKIATVAETVKSAAVEAVRTQNEEVLAVKEVDDVKPVETFVKNVEPAISGVPVVKTDVVVPVDELNEPSVKAIQEVIEVVKSAPAPQNASPLELFGTQLSNAVQNIQHSITNLPFVSNFVRPQSQQAAQAQEVAAAVEQADPQASTPAQPQLANSAAPAAGASSTFAAAPATSSPPNLFQNAFNSITSFLPLATTAKPQLANSISPAAAGSTQAVPVTSAPPNLIQNALQSITNFLQRSTTTAAPITEPAPAIISGTKGGDDNVIIEHYVNVDSKIDGIVKKKH